MLFIDIRTHFHSDSLAATQNSENAVSRELLTGVGDLLKSFGLSSAENQSGTLHYLGQMVYAQANALGFQDGFLVLSAGFLLAIVPAWFLGSSPVVKSRGFASN